MADGIERDLRINDLLARRTDLSTFIVYLARQTDDGNPPRKNLLSILRQGVIEARTAFGPAASKLQGKSSKDHESQNCVSFSETPLEHLYCLVQRIPERRFRLWPYGVAFTMMTARNDLLPSPSSTNLKYRR